jgi:hypothetical protein
MTTALTPFPPPIALPGSPLPAVFAGGPKAERRFWEFFATQLANDNTRRAYFNAVRRLPSGASCAASTGWVRLSPSTLRPI